MSDFESIKRIDEREKVTSEEKDEAKDINEKAKTDQIKDEKTDQIKAEQIEAEQIEDSKSNRKLKEDFSKKLFNYLCVWTVCVLLYRIVFFRVEK